MTFPVFAPVFTAGLAPLGAPKFALLAVLLGLSVGAAGVESPEQESVRSYPQSHDLRSAARLSLPAIRQHYHASPAHKALAVAGNESDFVYGIAHSERTDTAASTAALVQCRQSREAANLKVACEILELDATTVTRGSTIRAAALGKAHPLFLWQYDSPTARVFLAGSVHVLKASLYPLPPQFEQAFEAADHLAVEVDTITIVPQVVQQKVRQYSLLPEGQTLSTVLPPMVLVELQSYLAAQGIPLSNVTKLKPAMLATQLAVIRLMALGYLPEFGLEQHFVSRAGKRPVLQLETLDEQLDLLANSPMNLQVEMLMETLEQAESIEPIIAQTIKAWLLGDKAEFMRLFKLQNGDSDAFKAFTRRLLDERNVGMATKIQTYLQSRGTYFVMMGSAHLPGEEGVVALLRRRGVIGRRITSSDRLYALD